MKKRILGLFLVVALFVSANAQMIFAASVSNSDLEPIKEAMELIKENYKDDISTKQLADNAIKGMLKSLDPHSTYFTSKEYEDFIQSLEGGFSGIGVNIKKVDKYIQAIGIIKNSPAEKAGLKVGDKFKTVDGISVVDIEPDVFVSKVRGLQGTKVKVEVIRENFSNPIAFEITRDNIVVGSVEYKVMDNNIGYIKIDEFNSTTSSGVEEALKEFDKSGITKLIIDLRGNPGGYLSEVVKIGKTFIPKGPIVHIKEKDSPKQTYFSTLEKPKYKLAVLVDGGSASASEIFAGAVQDTKAGTIIGTKTYGKGTVQTFYGLANGSYIKLTIAKYLTPKERSVDGTGINPDIVVEDKSQTLNKDMFEPLKYVRDLNPGNKGADIFAVEQRLYALGYTVDGPDYKYDDVTKKGVINFKKDHKLLVSSKIDKKTQEVLDAALNDSMNKDTQLEKAIEVVSK